MNDLNKLPPGWHVPERSEGRGLWWHLALRSSGRATQWANLFLTDALRAKRSPWMATQAH